MNRPTGYRRNLGRRLLSSFDIHAHTLLATLPQSFSLSRFAPAIFDQDMTGSCVGHARSRGIATARMAAGHALPFIPSPADLYRLARCYERNDWALPLVDQGSDPVDTIDAVRTWGVRAMVPVLERYSDAAVETINDLPTLEDLEADHYVLLLNDYQITDTGAARIQAVCQALAAGYPVCIDVAGGASQFQTYDNNSPPLHSDGHPLDHYVCLVGYAKGSTGTMFEGHNSWGVNWGQDGVFQADESVIQVAGDLIVCVEDT